MKWNFIRCTCARNVQARIVYTRQKNSHLWFIWLTVFDGLVQLFKRTEIYGLAPDQHFWNKMFLYIFCVNTHVLEAFRQIADGHVLLCARVKQAVQVYERFGLGVLILRRTVSVREYIVHPRYLLAVKSISPVSDELLDELYFQVVEVFEEYGKQKVAVFRTDAVVGACFPLRSFVHVRDLVKVDFLYAAINAVINVDHNWCVINRSTLIIFNNAHICAV